MSNYSHLKLALITMPQRTARPALRLRKRPSQARSVETVRVLLEAAAQVLEQGGLDGLTTNAVAARAGVSIGSLYQYFPNKQALLATLIAEEQRQHRNTLQSAVDEARGLPLAAGLRHLLRAAIGRQTRRPELARALDYAETQLPMDEMLADTATAQRSELARFLAPHAGAIADQDLERAAGDALVIARALIDAAEADGSAVRDPVGLEDRVLRAVRGYLGDLGSDPFASERHKRV